ncbi:hypothetical protein HY024_01435 [Candidatus Curtissbacteria bacterium]|nr:hypothetical protein [Candidatus Curtissbacteria bacterium]
MISIVPSAISTLNPHALRSSLAIPAVCIICAVGVSYLISLLADKSRKIVLASYVAVVIISAFNFLFIYQNKYAVDSGWDWQAGIKSAVGIVTTEGDNYHDIYFDDGISKTAVLWYLKFNPTEYQHSQDKDNIGSYHFWTKYAPVPTTSHKSLFVTTQPSINGIFKGYVYFPNGSVAYGIWEI